MYILLFSISVGVYFGFFFPHRDSGFCCTQSSRLPAVTTKLLSPSCLSRSIFTRASLFEFDEVPRLSRLSPLEWPLCTRARGARLVSVFKDNGHPGLLHKPSANFLLRRKNILKSWCRRLEYSIHSQE